MGLAGAGGCLEGGGLRKAPGFRLGARGAAPFLWSLRTWGSGRRFSHAVATRAKGRAPRREGVRALSRLQAPVRGGTGRKWRRPRGGLAQRPALGLGRRLGLPSSSGRRVPSGCCWFPGSFPLLCSGSPRPECHGGGWAVVSVHRPPRF